MERGETQAETEAHVNCAKKVMMVLEMLALPEGGNVASQAKEEAAGGLSFCPADMLCLPGAGGGGCSDPVHAPEYSCIALQGGLWTPPSSEQSPHPEAMQ